MASNTPNLAALPSPQSITLLLKNDRSTTLLSAEPTSTFDELKVLLLAALKSRHVSGLPSSPATLEFAVLANTKDASKGWVPVHVKEQELAAGKTAKKGAAGKKAALDGSVEGAGLGDGSWVAWRVKSSTIKNDGVPSDVDGDEMALDIDDERDPGWNVKIPSYEDEEEQQA
jgi:hypothetical protein